MTSYIFLDTLRFFAHHGVGEQETVVGNEFTVSLRLQVDIRRAAETDDVADTVSYADVHTAVKAEMDIPSKLLEHVCGRIINRLFHDFPQIAESPHSLLIHRHFPLQRHCMLFAVALQTVCSNTAHIFAVVLQ